MFQFLAWERQKLKYKDKNTMPAAPKEAAQAKVLINKE